MSLAPESGWPSRAFNYRAIPGVLSLISHLSSGNESPVTVVVRATKRDGIRTNTNLLPFLATVWRLQSPQALIQPRNKRRFYPPSAHCTVLLYKSHTCRWKILPRLSIEVIHFRWNIMRQTFWYENIFSEAFKWEMSLKSVTVLLEKSEKL